MKKKTLIILIISLSVQGKVVYSQACPACSNPALQSSEKLEAGLDTLQKGFLRFTLNVTNGFDYQGGHPNYRGLTSDGQVITVPMHEHIVSLDFIRTEVSLEYTFATNWSAWLRIPYDIKIQKAYIDFPESVTKQQEENIIRNRDIHHRNENYYGISDLRFLLSKRVNGFIGKNGRLDIAGGFSLPTGKTEDNPLTAIAAGKKHLHIQFGTGTFDPLLEFHYSNVLTRKISIAFFTINKFPFYKNDKGYKGPLETTTGISTGYRLMKNLILRGTVANFSQSYAKWDEVNDPNSGLVSYNGNLGLTWVSKNGLMITPGYRFPIYQKTLSSGGDTFKYGPTFLLNISFPAN